MKIYIGADHAGSALKEKIKKELLIDGYDVKDFSPAAQKENDDYPDYAFLVAEAVAKDKNSAGILICDTGIGMAIAANKISGVYAAVVNDDFEARRSRQHNHANIIVLRSEGRKPVQAIKLVHLFLTTGFDLSERHERRLAKIKYYENYKQIPSNE